MSALEEVDGQIVPEDLSDERYGTDLEPVQAQPPSGLFRTDDPVEVIEKATQVATALKDVLTRQNLTTRISGKDHVNVEGWQTLGSMLGVVPVVTSSRPVTNVEGEILGYEAHVEARTLDGRVVGAGDGMCLRTERRGPWKSAEDYAIRSMAQTRATSKALKSALGFVMTLAGYESTPVEEMPAEPQSPYGEDANPATQRKVVEALEYLTGEGPHIEVLWEEMAHDADGHMPRVVARAVLRIAATKKALDNPEEGQGGDTDSSTDDGAE